MRRQAVVASVMLCACLALQASVQAQGPLPASVRIDGISVQARQALESRVGVLAVELGVSQRALAAVAERLGEKLLDADGKPDVSRILGLLDQQAATLKALETRLFSLEANNDPETAELLRRARELIDAGNLDGADAILAEARQAARSSRQQAQLREAEVISVEAETRVLRLDYVGAAELYAEAAETAPAENTIVRWRYRLDQANALSSRGEAFLDPGALQAAVDLYRTIVLPLAPRDVRPEDWALTQASLGIALLTMGERGNNAALVASVEAFQSVLEVLTRERDQVGWANAQMNLGNVLRVIGESGNDVALAESFAAYRSALEVMTRERTPQDWARTQVNLGNALLVKGERGDVAALVASVAAFRSALEVITRERTPQDWARTQVNLGNALRVMGEREDDGALAASVAAYRSALEVMTRERDPAGWAPAIPACCKARGFAQPSARETCSR